jgi:hypothetical protein
MGDMNFSLTTFNKTGKLMQIEYALARVNQGKMALGIKGKYEDFYLKKNKIYYLKLLVRKYLAIIMK